MTILFGCFCPAFRGFTSQDSTRAASAECREDAVAYT